MSNAISVSHGAFGRAALYRLDKALITHAHREGHLIFHVSGSFSNVAMADKSLDVDFQRGVAVSPLEPHSFSINLPEPSVVLVLYVEPAWLLKNSQSVCCQLRFGSSVIHRTDAIDYFVKRIADMLAKSQEPDNINSLLLQLVEQCHQQSWQGVEYLDLNRKSKSSFNDYRINRSLNTMQQQLSAEFDLSTVARSVGLSRPHFFKLFKKQMGITPNVYMNILRSEHAIEDLISTKKTVTNIASELGYSSQASFTRFFSSIVGIAPSEYRRIMSRSSRDTSVY